MKKIIALIALLVAGSSQAITPAQAAKQVNDIYSTDVKAVTNIAANVWYAYMMSNVEQVNTNGWGPFIWSRGVRDARNDWMREEFSPFYQAAEKLTAEQIAQIDEAFNSTTNNVLKDIWGVKALLFEWAYFPKTCERVAALRIAQSPNAKFWYNRYRYGTKHGERPSLEQRAAAFNEQIATFGDLYSTRQALINVAIPAVRTTLRRNGESFVQKRDDTFNPLEGALNQLCRLVNCPKQEDITQPVGQPTRNLKEWFKVYVPNYVWVDVPYEDDLTISNLKSDILSGLIPFDPAAQRKLFYHLGAERYNAFVDEYNGQTVEQ